MNPQMKAMTFKGRVIVIVSMVVVGAIAEGDGCRALNETEGGKRLAIGCNKLSCGVLTSYIKIGKCKSVFTLSLNDISSSISVLSLFMPLLGFALLLFGVLTQLF